MSILDNPNPQPQSPLIRGLIRLPIITLVLLAVGWLGQILVLHLALPAICFTVLAVLLFIIFLVVVCQTFGIGI
jgi:hypothetical protein